MALRNFERVGTSCSGRSKFVLSLVVGLFLCVFWQPAAAQVLGGMTGTITDQSGAVVPGANITVTNNATGVVHRGVTGSAGNYVITDLLPGNYTVQVAKRGFATFVTKSVNVEVGTKATANASLSTGTASQTVEVTAQAITLQTTEPDLGATITHNMLEQIPDQLGGVNGGVGPRGRQIDDFLYLAPGVQGGEFSHRINGGVDQENEVVFNGIPAVQSETQGFQSNINPPFEMVNQVKVISSDFSAQYGLGQGVASYQFASGTNQFHGDAFELLRNEALDSAGAVINAGPNPQVPVNKQHNFGFSLGGPVLLPHYNGKDRTFFHVSLEWYRFNQAAVGLMTVPTAAMKQGDFSAFPQPIYVPANLTSCAGLKPGQQFPNNVIPPNCISKLSSSLLSFLPNPDTGGAGNYINNLQSQIKSNPTTQSSWGFTIDHNLTTAQAIHASYWRDQLNTTGLGSMLVNNELANTEIDPRLGVGIFVNYTNALSPNLVATAGFGWMREKNNEFNTHLGVNFPGVVGAFTLPAIRFAGDPFQPTNWGLNTWGETQSINSKLGVSFQNNYLWTIGPHTLNFGFEARRSYQDDNECQQCGGGFVFNGITTSNGDTNSADPLNENNTGSSFASFLLGDVDNAQRQFAAESRLSNFYFAPYIQDNVKITPAFTLDWGLRWDLMQPFTEAGNDVVFFDPNRANPAAGGLLGAASKLGFCPGCANYTRANMSYRLLDPRLGFAYELNKKTAILGGYSFAHLNGGAYEYGTNKVAVNYGTLLAGQFTSASNGTNVPGYGFWDNNPLPVPAPKPFDPSAWNGTGTLHEFAQTIATPYVQNWNLAIQHEMPWNTLLSVAYVGNRAVHLPSQLILVNQDNPNILPLGATLADSWTSAAGQAALQAAGFSTHGTQYFTPYANFINDFGPNTSVRQALRPYPQYHFIQNDFDMSGAALYNALQVKEQKAFANGVDFLVAYTLSRTMSNTDSGFGTFNGTALNSYNLKPEWTLAGNDQTHLVTVSFVYMLPVGPGKAWLNTKDIAGKVLGGWQLSGVLSYASGSPFGIGANGSPLLTGNRANLTGQPINLNYSNYAKGLPVFNAAAFSDPGQFVLGNSPRNVAGLRTPFFSNENLALAKHINFTERFTGEMQIQFFNVLNRVVICGPGDTNVSDLSSGNFGMVFGPSQCNAPRQGQAFFKLSW